MAEGRFRRPAHACVPLVGAADQGRTSRERSRMNAQDDGQTEHRTAPADTKDRAIAVVGAWICIGVAAIVAALILLL